MIVNEKFRSLQGEGPCVGFPSTFVRFSKCVLNCPFCDSKHTWKDEEGNIKIEDTNSFQELLDYIEKGPRHVVLTGGEPLINYDGVEFRALLYYLVNHGYETTLETTLLTNINDIKNKDIKSMYFHLWDTLGELTNICRFMVSPKMDTRCYDGEVTEDDIIRFYSFPQHVADKFTRLDSFFYKIVYDQKYEKLIVRLLNSLPEDWVKNYVYMMPLTPQPFNDKFEEYRESCIKTQDFCMKYEVKYSPRIHIDMFGGKRGV